MTNDEIRISFNEMLDDVYGDFHIGHLGFSASTILESCDPIAYNEMLYEFELRTSPQFI